MKKKSRFPSEIGHDSSNIIKVIKLMILMNLKNYSKIILAPKFQNKNAYK